MKMMRKRIVKPTLLLCLGMLQLVCFYPQASAAVVVASSTSTKHAMRSLQLDANTTTTVAGNASSSSNSSNYRATFRAQWMLNLDTSICGGDFAVKRISCLNGTTLSNVEPMSKEDVECTMVEDSDNAVMECTDLSADVFVNGWSGVFYVRNVMGAYDR